MAKEIATNVYDGVAEYGKIITIIGAIFATVIGLVVFGIGIYLISKKSVLTKTAVGKIVTINNDNKCAFIPGDYNRDTQKTGSSSWDCAITVSFEAADGKSYTHSETTRSQSMYHVGDTITVHYNPSKPSSSSLSSDDLRLCGAAMVGGALIVVTIAWLYVWFTRVNKVAAAVSGASSIASIFRG